MMKTKLIINLMILKCQMLDEHTNEIQLTDDVKLF